MRSQLTDNQIPPDVGASALAFVDEIETLAATEAKAGVVELSDPTPAGAFEPRPLSSEIAASPAYRNCLPSPVLGESHHD